MNLKEFDEKVGQLAALEQEARKLDAEIAKINGEIYPELNYENIPLDTFLSKLGISKTHLEPIGMDNHELSYRITSNNVTIFVKVNPWDVVVSIRWIYRTNDAR